MDDPPQPLVWPPLGPRVPSSASVSPSARKKIVELVERAKRRLAPSLDTQAPGDAPGRTYVLDLARHTLSGREVELLVELLCAQEDDPGMRDDHGCGDGRDGARPVAAAAGVLRLDGYRMGDVGAAAVAAWLARPSCRATELSLAAGDGSAKALELVEAERKDIGEKGGAMLGRALLANRTLQVLDLRSNSLSSISAGRPSASMVAFARALQVNDSLTHLDLSGNLLSEFDAMLLADALRRNHALTRLNLAKTRASKEGTMRAIPSPWALIRESASGRRT